MLIQCSLVIWSWLTLIRLGFLKIVFPGEVNFPNSKFFVHIFLPIRFRSSVSHETVIIVSNKSKTCKRPSLRLIYSYITRSRTLNSTILSKWFTYTSAFMCKRLSSQMTFSTSFHIMCQATAAIYRKKYSSVL